MRCGCLSLNTGKMNSKTFNGACNWIFLIHWNFRRSLVASVHCSSHTHSLSIYRACTSDFLSLFFFATVLSHSIAHWQKSYHFGVTSRLWPIFISFFFPLVFLFAHCAASNLNFIALTVVKLDATETAAMNVNGEQQSKKNELCSGTHTHTKLFVRFTILFSTLFNKQHFLLNLFQLFLLFAMLLLLMLWVSVCFFFAYFPIFLRGSIQLFSSYCVFFSASALFLFHISI